MDCAALLAARAEGIEAVAAPASQDDLGHDAAGGISGAEEEHVIGLRQGQSPVESGAAERRIIHRRRARAAGSRPAGSRARTLPGSQTGTQLSFDPQQFFVR